MRCLGSAWEQGAVDSASAVWLIDEALQIRSPDTQIEAAALLELYVRKLVVELDGETTLYWPSRWSISWHTDVPLDVRIQLIVVAVKATTLRPRSQWRATTPAINTLYAATVEEDDPPTKNMAARLLLVMLEGIPASHTNTTFGARWVSIEDMRSAARAVVEAGEQELLRTREFESILRSWNSN